MKKFYLKLSVVLITVFTTQQNIAQNNYGQYENNNYRYDLSDNLDLEAVASAFYKSRNITDFEEELNDYHNQVSNLDLNNDGYVDYLRLVKLYDRGAHVILIQAIVGRDYYQDVATVVVGRDQYNREYVQIIGDSYLYGEDYILEPVFSRRPSIVRWLWSNTNHVYVSRYNWGFYPGYFRLRNLLSIDRYFNHIHVFVDVHHRYHYTDRWRHSSSFEHMNSYKRNDYWRNHDDKRFDQRNQSIKNKGYFQHNQDRKEADIRERQPREVRSTESQRRENNSGTAPQRDTRSTQPRVVTPQRDTRDVAPQRDVKVVVPQRDNSDSRERETRVVTPQRETKVVPQRDSKVSTRRDVKVSTSRESKVTPKSDTKSDSKETKKETTTRKSDDRNSSSGRR